MYLLCYIETINAPTIRKLKIQNQMKEEIKKKVGSLWKYKKRFTFAVGENYTTSSLPTPPGQK